MCSTNLTFLNISELRSLILQPTSYVIFRCAFIEYLSAKEATTAMEKLNESELQGRNLKIQYCGKKVKDSTGPGEKTATLFVGNLRQKKLTEVALKMIFTNSKSVYIPKEKHSGRNRG